MSTCWSKMDICWDICLIVALLYCVYVCVAALVSMISISSASAIMLIFIVALWVCWWVKCLHRWQVAAWQVMRWRANEGNAASVTQCETNRMCRSLTQLAETPVSQTGSNVAKADRCLCHRSPACRQVENVPSVSMNNRFIFQFPALAFSSVTSGNCSSRLLLVGPLSSMTH